MGEHIGLERLPSRWPVFIDLAHAHGLPLTATLTPAARHASGCGSGTAPDTGVHGVGGGVVGGGSAPPAPERAPPPPTLVTGCSDTPPSSSSVHAHTPPPVPPLPATHCHDLTTLAAMHTCVAPAVTHFHGGVQPAPSVERLHVWPPAPLARTSATHRPAVAYCTH